MEQDGGWLDLEEGAGAVASLALEWMHSQRAALACSGDKVYAGSGLEVVVERR
jgi:hypothetical protein